MKTIHQLRPNRLKKTLTSFFTAFITIFLVVFISTATASEGNFLKEYLSQTNGATAGWFGLAQPLKSYGLKVTGEAKEIYFGQVTGGLPNQPKGNWLNEEKLKFVFDFEPLFGISGLTIQSNWRYRGGGTPQWAAGTPSNFNPTTYASGTGVRILTQQIEYSTPNKAITINAGWENPYEQFLQQPLSKFFENNSITSSKGIGGAAGPGIPVVNKSSAYNAAGVPTAGSVRYYTTSPVPWGSTYAAWGGTLKVKAVKDVYIQSGLYAAISGTSGVNNTQYNATSVYPYTSVPQSYLGQFKQSGQIVPVVGGNGRIIPGASQNIGWVAGAQNNHGFNFQGSPGFNPNGGNIGVKPTTPVNTPGVYNNGSGKFVKAPAYYAASPYNQGSGGNYSQNGLYNVNEIGWTPKFGKDKLEGKYAIGSYIWGQNNTDYTPVVYTPSTFTKGTATYTSYAATKPFAYHRNQVVWGLYLQADQRLYAVKEAQPSDPLEGKNPVDKNPVPATSYKVTDKGLYTFNEFTFTPPQNNQLPFYFQTGLVYKGLIPRRDDDSAGIALGAGFYSSYYNAYLRTQNQALQNAYGSANNASVPNGPVQQGTVNPATGAVSTGTSALPLSNFYAYQPAFSSTEVIEAFYNVQLNKWSAVKPFAQYIINPAGNGTVGNDLVLGVSAKLTF